MTIYCFRFGAKNPSEISLEEYTEFLGAIDSLGTFKTLTAAEMLYGRAEIILAADHAVKQHSEEVNLQKRNPILYAELEKATKASSPATTKAN